MYKSWGPILILRSNGLLGTYSFLSLVEPAKMEFNYIGMSPASRAAVCEVAEI